MGLYALRSSLGFKDDLYRSDPPVRLCGEGLEDPDGFTAHCTVEAGREHSHHDRSAREAVTWKIAARIPGVDL